MTADGRDELSAGWYYQTGNQQPYLRINGIGVTTMEPKIAQKSPIAVELVAGKAIYWCSCGQSSKQPYCDGSHAGSGFVPMPYTQAASGTAYLCACKHTKNPPLCDGSHNAL